jgi:hypothetical protein
MVRADLDALPMVACIRLTGSKPLNSLDWCPFLGVAGMLSDRGPMQRNAAGWTWFDTDQRGPFMEIRPFFGRGGRRNAKSNEAPLNLADFDRGGVGIWGRETCPLKWFFAKILAKKRFR